MQLNPHKGHHPCSLTMLQVSVGLSVHLISTQNMNFMCQPLLLKVMDQRVQQWSREQRKMVRSVKQWFYLARLNLHHHFIYVFMEFRGKQRGIVMKLSKVQGLNKYAMTIVKRSTAVHIMLHFIITHELCNWKVSIGFVHSPS